MKKTISMVMMVLAAAVAGRAAAEDGGSTEYVKGRVYGPIEILGDKTVTLDGNGAIIDGGGKARCATLGPNVTLRNFTFRNGKAAVGGGVWGGAVENCMISGCKASECGAAVANCKVSATTISGCKFPLSSSKVAIHGGIVADSVLNGVTIIGCRVELGTTVPGFGGIAANSELSGCSVRDNSFVISGDHYGLLFYGGSVGGSTIKGNSVNSSVENVAAWMKVEPVNCTLDGGDDPVPPPGPDPDAFDGTVANNYVVTLADGTSLVVSTAKQTVKNGVATCVLTAKRTVGKKTYSYTAGKVVDGAVTTLPTCKTSGVPQFEMLALTRNDAIGVFDGDGFAGNLLTKDDFVDGPEFVRWTPESPLRVGVTYSAQMSVSERCGPVKYSASKLPTGLKIDTATGRVTGVPTAAKSFKTRITATSTVNSKLKAYTEFEEEVKVASLDAWAVGTFYGHGDGREAKITVSSAGKISGTLTLSGAKWTVSSTTFTGYADGVYSVTLACKKGKEARSFEVLISEVGLVVTDVAQGVSFTGNRLTKEIFATENISWTSELPLRVGVAYSATLGVSEMCGPVKYSASKLPAGLKVAQDKASGTWRVTGVPTAAKSYKTRITATSTIVSSLKAYTDFQLRVAPLDTWAQGTFDGGADETFAAGGQATFTVSKAGKLSGKWLSGGTNWTLTAASYDRYDAETASYVAQVVGKAGSGKKARVFTTELAVAKDAVGGVATSEFFLAYLNNWKIDPWKTIGKKVAKAAAFEFRPYADAGDVHTNDILSLKFAASGKVTVKASYFKSISKTGKISWTTASGSAVLCPQDLPGEGDAFPAAVFVYLPPKKGTPTEKAAYAVCVRLWWNGAKFVEWTEPE